MARSCTVSHLTSYGDKKSNSILYDTLFEAFGENRALEYWRIVKDPKYNKLHEDPNNLDNTGELKFDVFITQVYNRDISPSNNKSPLSIRIAEIRTIIRQKIGILKGQVTSDATLESSRKKRMLVDLQVLESVMNDGSVSEAQFLVQYIDTMYTMTEDSLKTLDRIGKSNAVVSKDIMDLVDIRNEFASMGIFEDIEKLATVPEVKQYLEKVEIQRKVKNPNELAFSEKIAHVINQKRNVDREYMEKAIPLMADWLLDYNSNTINASVFALINNITTYKRGKSFVIHDDEYKKLTKDLKDKKISQSEYDQKIENLAIQQVKNRNLINRESLINDLKLAYKDKSGFSLLFDPFIYTSDKVLGLFAKALKEEMYKATIATRDTAIQMEKELYRKFIEASGRSSSNADSFNDGLFEEIEVYSPSHNKRIKRLSFIQPWDMSKFHTEQSALWDNLHQTIVTNLKSRNIIIKDADLSLPQKEFNEWLQTEDGKKWNKNAKNPYAIERNVVIAKWFSENTEAVEGAYAKIEQISKELATLRERKQELEAKKLTGTITEDEKSELRRTRILEEERKQWWHRNVAGKFNNRYVAKGELAQPKTEKYGSAKFNVLKQNKPLFDYYTGLLEQYKKDQKRLPKSKISNNAWDKFTYFLPSIRKNNKDILIESHGSYINALKEGVWDAFARQETDTQFGITDETGAETKMIPIYFTNAVESKHISKDIISSVLQFHNMVNEYEAKANIHAQVMLIQDIINKRDTAETNSKNQPIWNAVAKKFGLERFIKQRKTSNYAKSLEAFINLNFYDEKMSASTINIFGKDVSLTKVANKLAAFTGLNALAFNFLQGINNVMFGNLMYLTESVGGQYFNKTDWAKSQDIFWRQNSAGIPDLGKFNPTTKMGQMREIYDPNQGNIKDMIGKDITGSALKKALDGDTLFFLQNGGEYQMQTQTMIGVTIATTVKDASNNYILNEDGSKMSLYDAYQKNKDGKLELDKRVATIQLKKYPESDVTVGDIRDIIHGINGKMHGKYNTFDRSTLQMQWYGQLVMLFRGWMIPGIRKRWGFSLSTNEPSMDFETGHLNEGMYISFIKLFKESFVEKQGLLATYKHMTEMEKANVVKTMTELLVMASLVLIIKGLQSIDADDDDQELYFVMYQLRRLQSDLGFYYNRRELFKILKSPSATLTIWSKLGKFFDQVWDPTEEYQVSTAGNKKGDNKLWARTKDIIPLLNNIEKSLTPEDSYKWFISKQW